VTLLTETLMISLGMAGISLLPLYSGILRKYSSLFYLVGTGALAGILVFDLLPDLYELGGIKSLSSVALVWLAYSLLHLLPLNHHENLAELSEVAVPLHHHGHQSSRFFLFSMSSHCFASGILLVTSQQFSTGLNRSVFLALVAHKLYEALTVSAVLVEKQKSHRKSFYSIFIYSASLPVGVALTYEFRNYFTPGVALLATSLAAGTLLGCLIFDFLLPSLVQIRRKISTLGWVVLGLFSAQFLVKLLS
jgi:zinc transporter ZupT